MVTDTVENVARAWIKLARSHTRLFLLEAKLARDSIVPFFALLLGLLILAGCLCLCALGTLLLALYQVNHNLLFSMLIVDVVGVIGFVATLWLLFVVYKQLLFAKTRQSFKNKAEKLALTQEDVAHE